MRSFEDTVTGLTSRDVEASVLRQLIEPHLEALELPDGLSDAALREAARRRLRGDLPLALRQSVDSIRALADRTQVEERKRGGQLELMSLLEPRNALASAARIYVRHHEHGHVSRLLLSDQQLEGAHFVHMMRSPQTPFDELERLLLCHQLHTWLHERGARLFDVSVDRDVDALHIEVVRDPIDGRSGVVADHLTYYPDDFELHVWSGWPQVHLFLAESMGTVLFEERRAFQLKSAYTAAPLEEQGVRALSTEGSPKIEFVKLLMLKLSDLESPFDIVTWEGENIGMRLEHELSRFMWKPRRIHSVKLAFYLQGERNPVMVTLRPPSFFRQSRKTGQVVILNFLLTRGFMRRASPAEETTHAHASAAAPAVGHEPE